MRTNRFLAAAGVTAALAAGGVGAFVIGVPGVSGAQTTTEAPTTTVPGTTDDGTTAPARPGRAGGENCPEKDSAGTGTGTAPSTGSSANISARGRGGNFSNL